MKAFEKAKWIWVDNNTEQDVYGEFILPFTARNQAALLRISCDSDYTLFVNGTYVASNQYLDFEHYKIYDEIDIAPYLREGENVVAVLVWHFGLDSQRYVTYQAGLLLEIVQDGVAVVSTDETVLCRKSRAYKNGHKQIITYQLGYSFLYDATKEDNWINGEAEGLAPAVCVEKNCTLYKRPIPKQIVEPRKSCTILKDEGNYYLIDLGEETLGLPSISFTSETEQTFLVAWGEDLQNGHVRRIIDNRDFSYEYVAKKGQNDYTNYMLRTSGRYLEVYSKQPITLTYAGVLPQVYPVVEKPFTLQDETEQRIYDVCVRTLRLSMMEHYVDTPWREQCLYAMDSRNQMLCGYYAFENGNSDYVRANLQLMCQDRREDGLLSMCFPSGLDLTIPSFSLHFYTAVREYVDYTGDIEFVKGIYPKLLSVIEKFVERKQNGLVGKFKDARHWNFYEWIPCLSGRLFRGDTDEPDLMLNTLLIIALENLREIAAKVGEQFPYQGVIEEIRTAARKTFYNPEKGAFAHGLDGKDYTVLGNACAILAGLVQGEEKKALCEKILSGELLACTLSMKYFKYQALISTDEKYVETVLEEIRQDYTLMLDAGATSVWETIEGAADFDNAGSLCHGWSALPVYYYHLYRK